MRIFDKLTERLSEVIYVKVIVLTLLVLILTGCAVAGSKEALKISDNSTWKTIETGHGDYHHFSCEKLSISFDEIVFKTKTLSYGLVVPVIPSGKERNFENNNLKLRIEIIGSTDVISYIKEDFELHVTKKDRVLSLSDQNLIKVNEKYTPEAGSQWVQYIVDYEYSYVLRNISNLKVKFKYPFSSCSIPDLNLTREKMSDNEFIVAPGV